MKAKPIKRIYATEHEEQMTLLQWAGTVKVGDTVLARSLIMIPNEGLLSLLAAGGRRYAYWHKLLRLGFRKGASDLFLAIPAGGAAGLWIEMKRQRAAYRGNYELEHAVSEEQTKFHLQMRGAGYATCVAHGWEEARYMINAYLVEKLPTAA